MFVANSKPLWKKYTEFSIPEPKNKNYQVMGNSGLKLKKHFKVFSYHNTLELDDLN